MIGDVAKIAVRHCHDVREFQKSLIFGIPTLMYMKKNCQVITV